MLAQALLTGVDVALRLSWPDSAPLLCSCKELLETKAKRVVFCGLET